MKKHVLVTLLMAALFVSGLQMASAKTVLVNAAGTDGAVKTIAEAMAKTVAGDQIVITDSGTYATAAWLDLDGRTLRGQMNAPNQATIDDGGFLGVHNATLENFKVKMTFGWGNGIRCWGTFKLSKLLIDGKDEGSSPIIIDSAKGMQNTGVIEYVTTYNVDAPNGVIQFGGGWSDKPTSTTTNNVTTAAEIGPITINHCTLTHKGGYVLQIAKDYSTDGSEVEVKNSILGAVTPGDTPVSAIFNNMSTRKHPPMYNHHHNLYTNIWMFECYDWPLNGGNFFDVGSQPSEAKGEIGAGFTNTNPFVPVRPDPRWFAAWEKLSPSVSGKCIVTPKLLNTEASATPVKPVIVATDKTYVGITPWTSVSMLVTGKDADGNDQTETVAAAVGTGDQAGTWTGTATKSFKKVSSIVVTVTPGDPEENDTMEEDQFNVGYTCTTPASLTWDNMKLRPYYSPALWAGDDDLHMGSDVNTVPVELSNFEIQ